MKQMYFVAIHLFYKSCCICLIGNLCVLLSHNEHWHERKQPQASRFTFCHIARFRSSCSFCSSYVNILKDFHFTQFPFVSYFLYYITPLFLKASSLRRWVYKRYNPSPVWSWLKSIKRLKSVNGCISAINEWKSF